MMRVVIVDDEPIARRGLRNLLADHADVAVIGEARNGRDAVHVIVNLRPDLLLLDVQMPGGNAFDVLRSLRPPLPAVIFVTAYDDYAVRAFETHALDYLVKPVHEDRFRAAIGRARDQLRTAAALEQAQRLGLLLQTDNALIIDPVPASAQRLVIPRAQGELVLESADISWIEADNYYAAIHARGRRHLLRESLDSLERRLDPQRFVRVHRSAIVNLACVMEVRRGADHESAILLRDGTNVPLSRRRRTHLADALRRSAAVHAT